jgi:nitroimidazol reductase NimA-like FMN-containing flavoprotein (pyridoxamine 5'-phosphate oxidase superfamily)/Mg-chelatase subunit ChlD
MRRKDKEISELQQIEAIITDSQVCRLGLSLDGQAYVVPVNFGYDDRALYIHSAQEGKKLDILRQNPRVCVEFDLDCELVQGEKACDWGMTFRSAIGFGRASFLTNLDEKRNALLIIMQQYAGHAEFSFSDAALRNTAVIRIDIEEISGKKPVQTAEADTMVALGAAILAKGAYKPRRPVVSSGIKKNVVSGLTLINFTRTAPRNLGTKVIVKEGQDVDICNSVIIPYGTDIPTAKTREDYQVSAVGQAFFDIPVVEYDDIGPEVIQDTWRFECPSGLPQGTPVHVTFHYDKSGRIDVEAVEQHTQTQLTGSRVTYEEPDLEAIKFASPPRNVIFALDVSGSMETNDKIERAKQAVIDNSRTLITSGGGQVQVGVVAFGSSANVICPLTADLQTITTSVSQVGTYGTTAMGAGITLALNMLSKSNPEVMQEIVLVSDGMPDEPDEALTAGAKAQKQGVNFCLLGIGHEDVNEDFLKQMTPNYLVIDNADGISQAISNLLTQTTPTPGTPQAGITWL